MNCAFLNIVSRCDPSLFTGALEKCLQTKEILGSCLLKDEVPAEASPICMLQCRV